MTVRLVLTLVDNQLTLVLVKIKPFAWIRTALKLTNLGRPRQSNDIWSKPIDALARVDVIVQDTPNAWAIALDSAWAALNAQYSLPTRNVELVARLGFRHTRMGLIGLNDADARATDVVCSSYANAWVGKLGNLEPASQVIRWQRLEAAKGLPARLVIFCIDRVVFNALQSFSNRKGLRFVSCQAGLVPLLNWNNLPLMTASIGAHATTTLICSEVNQDGGRTNVVQLLRYENGQIQALWRGWLPAPLETGTDDHALDGAVRRFQLTHRASVGEAVSRFHWQNSVLAQLNE